MKDTNLKAKELLTRYLDGRCTVEERDLVESVYRDAALKRQFKDRPVEFNKIGKESWQYIHGTIAGQPRLRQTVFRKGWWMAAASVLLAVGLSVYFYQAGNPFQSRQSAYVNDVKAGGNKAFLTLADGTRISLTDAKNGALAQQSGIQITKTAEGKLIYNTSFKRPASLSPQGRGGKAGEGQDNFNTIETPKGGQYQVILPDGTKVWLNAASSLKYPTYFAGNVRKVILQGEAYFEVVHNKQQPFQVGTSKQTVEVLGTHFNINSYLDDGNTQTTLLEGSVRVNAQTNVVLKPGQQSVLNTKNEIKVRPANLETVMAWKNGDFIFKDENLENIMAQITRWYDVDVVYEDLDPKSVKLGGWVSRSKNLSAVLKIIESIAKVHFKVEGRRVTVMK